ncbi:winged helix-turn-helix transcriptional regulator [Mycobacterium kubicae]|uniref:winged helix-turn-helix transcriptional regulator n=1 Tax=Mycobacterium kubicae TaxID=120959 RepID=UPI0007FD9D0A|nr:helix-turn-helix domain-containing protein [Mycobacterium kubicae]OBK49064.1 hypothetical protein A5657_02055 [Mycobacterium kubicae]
MEVLGDRWSLLILRDVMFANRRHFRDLLKNSEERISSNILATRLTRLVDQGLLTQAGDPSHKQKVVYSLTEEAIELVPVMVQLGVWGAKHQAADPTFARQLKALDRKGPHEWQRLMDQLRELHADAVT